MLERLRAFLRPVGDASRIGGWELGRSVNRSDLVAEIAAVPGSPVSVR